MNRKVLIVGGIALAAATAATLFFYTLLSDRIGGGSETVKMGSVAVAARSLPRGAKITADDLELETRPAAEIPPDAFRTKEELEGRYLAAEVMAGRPVTSASLPANGNGGVSGVIPPGMRAISIHVEQYVGVNRLVEVGDRVDVLASNWLRSPGRTDTTIATVLQNVEVLATDRSQPGRLAQIPNVTVLVNADQAGRLTLADQASELRLALRNPIDEEIIEAEDLRAREVLADGRSSKRVVRTDDGSDRSQPPPPPHSTSDAPVSQAPPGDGPRAALKE